jgi:hypothetical protein
MSPQADIIKKILSLCDKTLTISEFRSSSKDFTRDRTLNFSFVVFSILNLFKDSVETTLPSLLSYFNKKPITAAAFSIARYKVKFEIFKKINSLIIENSQNLSKKTWKGYNLIAGDGTTVNLPPSKKNKEHFGIHSTNSGNGCKVLARAFFLYNIKSQLIIGSTIDLFSKSEHALFYDIFPEIHKNDKNLIVLDRHFSSLAMIKFLKNKNVKFCIRLTNSSLFAKNALKNIEDDFITEWIPSRSEKKTCLKKGFDIEPVKVRVTKIELKSGIIELLVTEFFDMDKISKEDIGKLYNSRWDIEEAIKKIKSKMKLEEFSCKIPKGIFQEFYAHIAMYNLTILVGNQANMVIRKKTKKRKRKYKYNFQTAYKTIRNNLNRMIKEKTKTGVKNILLEILEVVVDSKVAIVPGRSFVRIRANKDKARCHQCYK